MSCGEIGKPLALHKQRRVSHAQRCAPVNKTRLLSFSKSKIAVKSTGSLYCVLLPLSLFITFSSETFLKATFLGLCLNGRSLRLGCHLTSSIGALCGQLGSCRRVCQIIVRMMRCLDSLGVLMAIYLSFAFRWEGVVNIWLLKQKTLFKTLP